MKAMILAAGFGTRLLPHTEKTHKALFTVAGRPILDILIGQLAAAGVEAVIINAHHLAGSIEGHCASASHPVPVTVRREETILGTGGAIKHVEDFWDHRPFLVLNSDIVTDIDFRAVYEFHVAHPDPVTLVLVDAAEFNTVSVTPDGYVTGFEGGGSPPGPLTFTGIQVLDPTVLEEIPANTASSSIDAYRRIIARGDPIRAYLCRGCEWKDIGTPERYREAVIDRMTPMAAERAWPGFSGSLPPPIPLKGDGSERKWYRIGNENRSMILVDHGIGTASGTAEIDAFVAIGTHLGRRRVPVPRIYLHDRFSGVVFLEDLGDTHLQSAVRQVPDTEAVASLYRRVIDGLLHMALAGADGFDTDWTWQSAAYDREVVLEKECRYFVDAYLRQFLGLDIRFEHLEEEFNRLADLALAPTAETFMHRDFQSRNIMIRDGDIFFIDFQGGRMGPVGYDLASLLIDPYVGLPRDLQAKLLDHAAFRLAEKIPLDRERFLESYRHCALARNLQILGAFAFLTRQRGKPYFAAYIPRAVRTLSDTIETIGMDRFPKLGRIVCKIDKEIPPEKG
jgi:aminoglycoside/choline kinase family phosphotransferase/dTDP-glucose pyrophosphorylase